MSTKSPSTLRRQLAIADTELADAIVERDQVQSELMAASADHQAIEGLSMKLAASQNRVDTAEARWLSLADDAESLGMEI